MSTGRDPRVVQVGIAEGAVVRRPLRLQTSGLGSCVGLVLYDETTGWCGLVHIMLARAPKDGADRPQKYADSAVSWLVGQLTQRGVHPATLRAKMAGGSQMFAFVGKPDMMKIGQRNIEVVREELRRLRLPVIADDVGGQIGRTICFDSLTSMLAVRTANHGTYII